MYLFGEQERLRHDMREEHAVEVDHLLKVCSVHQRVTEISELTL